jgi:hypothetical protein
MYAYAFPPPGERLAADWWQRLPSFTVRLSARWTTNPRAVFVVGALVIDRSGFRWAGEASGHGKYAVPAETHTIPWAGVERFAVQGGSESYTSLKRAAFMGVLAPAAPKSRGFLLLKVATSAREDVFRLDSLPVGAGSIESVLRPFTSVMEQGLMPAVAPAGFSVADEISKLSALLDRGLISPDEFAVQKGRLLA